MKKQLSDYLHFYLGCQVQVRKKHDSDNYLIGRICEVTKGSNHSDWIKVDFGKIVYTINRNFEKLSSNFHTFFIEEDDIQLILRPLSEMTEEEISEYNKLYSTLYNMADGINQIMQQASCVRYLISSGFDIFGLHEAGLCLYRNENGELY